VSDWFDDESDEAPPPREGEGVRILGADSGGMTRRERRLARESGGSTAPAEEEPPASTWSASSESGEQEAVRLPHWTEPPSGAVPSILGGEADEVEPEDPWGAAPRFRTEGDDWSESDFSSPDLKDETIAIGALAEGEPDEDFDEQVAARRGRGAPRPTAEAERPGPSRDFGFDDPVDEDGEPPQADLTTRVVTAVVMAAVAIVLLWAGRGTTTLLVAVIVGAASFEIYQGFRHVGFKTASALGILASVALVFAAYKRGEAAYPLVTALLVLFTFLWYMVEVVKARPAVNIGMTLLGYGYVGIFGGFAGLMLAAPNGVGLVLGTAICAIGYDIVGYFVGKNFGRSKLAPRLSPNKTYEGLFAGMAASLVLGGIVAGVLQITPWDSFGHGLALGLVVAIAAPLGDLCESMLKRDLQIKDFGSILPGHGGVLDRFDAILICLPAAYYLARALEIG
jgi:phosphatidate cytidylyltransferase